MKDIIILGTAGTCIDILEIIESINKTNKRDIYNILGFLDDDEDKYLKEIYNIKVIGKLSDAYKYPDSFFVNGIGSVNNFFLKKRIIDTTRLPAEKFESFVHPSAIVSEYSEIKNGTVIFQNVVISSSTSVGKHVIILPNTVINHDSTVGDYSCITSGVLISGGVSIGQSCYLGTGSCLNNGINVGDECLIGMGSVVVDNTQKGNVYYGNPAKLKRTIRKNLN